MTKKAKKVRIGLSPQDQFLVLEYCLRAMSDESLFVERLIPSMEVVDRYFTPVKVMNIRHGSGKDYMEFTLPQLIAVNSLLSATEASDFFSRKIFSMAHKKLHGGNPKYMLNFRNSLYGKAQDTEEEYPQAWSGEEEGACRHQPAGTLGNEV